MLKSPHPSQDDGPKDGMKRQLINLEQSMQRGEPPKSAWQNIRFWLHNHLRLVWNLIMMAILFAIFLFVTFVSGSKHQEGAIIENIAPELSRDIDGEIEKAVQRTAAP